MVVMVVSFYWVNNYPEKLPLSFDIFYLTYSRGIFIIGMCMLLMPVLMGHGVLIRKFLSTDMFTVLARLTYGAYLSHPIFQRFNTFNTERGLWVSHQQGIVLFLAWVLAAYATSMVLTVMVESPCGNLEKKYLFGARKKKPRA